jgi:hypothetical protein
MEEVVFDTEKGKKIPYDTLVEIYNKAFDLLDKAYQSGCTAWISANRKDIEQQINQAQAVANKKWLDCEAGTGTVEQFKVALTDWYKAYRLAIIAYAQYLVERGS